MKYLPFVFLLIAFQLFLLVNLQFTAWPEMFSYAYLKNNGFLLYKDMIHPYPPVLTLTLSYIYKVFGYGINILKTFSWLVILSSSVCVWLLTKEITGKSVAALTALAFYVLTQPFLEGNMMWFDIAVVPPLLLGAYFLLRHNLFASGFFLSLAGFTKQTGGLFYVVVLVYLIWHGKSTLLRPGPKKNAISFLFGPIIFGAPLLIKLIQENAVEEFLNWVIYYPSVYWSKFPGYVQMSPGIKSLFVVGLFLAPALWLGIKNKIFQNKKWQVIALFLVLSVVTVYPRFSFFHLQSTLAFSAVFYGFLIVQLPKKLQAVSVVLIGLIYILIWPQIRLEWGSETRFYAREDQKLAQDISRINSKKDKVFLQGLHSSLYSMSGQVPPKPWADNFGWYFEIPGVQEDTINRWAQNPPEVILWRTPNNGNWFDLGTYQPSKIVNWIEENYFRDKELRPGVWVWRRKIRV